MKTHMLALTACKCQRTCIKSFAKYKQIHFSWRCQNLVCRIWCAVYATAESIPPRGLTVIWSRSDEHPCELQLTKNWWLCAANAVVFLRLLASNAQGRGQYWIDRSDLFRKAHSPEHNHSCHQSSRPCNIVYGRHSWAFQASVHLWAPHACLQTQSEISRMKDFWSPWGCCASQNSKL